MNWLNQGLLLVPWPQDITQAPPNWTLPEEVRCYVPSVRTEELDRIASDLGEDVRRLTGRAVQIVAGTPKLPAITLSLAAESAPLPTPRRPEGYALRVDGSGARLVGDDISGLAHAAQTLAQLIAFSSQPGSVPGVEIRDWPAYALRAVMLDIGRAPFSRALIERVIRIMARLKLNTLHLHLHDDELNGVRYATLPLGQENPAALPITTYGELIEYAGRYRIQVMPELEAWGHVSSLLYHYPELYGTTGQYGQSFGIGEPTYDLLDKIIGEWIPLLQGDPAYLHVGLDEADWSLLSDIPPERREAYTPVTHVRRLYDIIQRHANAHGKRVEMHLWADHGGRPIPEELRAKVVTEPWMYHVAHADRIREYVYRYGGTGKTPFMMGAGASFIHEQGAFGATKVWCREAKHVANCRGVTLCVWGSNDIAGRLITIFAGADYAWSPDTPLDLPGDFYEERLRGMLVRRMKYWQAHFPEADGAALDIDRGPEVLMGRYCFPPRMGEAVGPTADWDVTPPRRR